MKPMKKQFSVNCGASKKQILIILCQWALQPVLRRSFLVRWLALFGVGTVLCGSTWAQAPARAPIAFMPPPDKNGIYAYADATKILAYWDAKPRPEIRVIYDEILNGNKVESYKYKVITNVTIYARDTATGKPLGVFVTLARPPKPPPGATPGTNSARIFNAGGDWKNTKGDSGSWDLSLTLYQNGTATGIWGGYRNAFNGRWSGNTVTWTDGKYNCKCTLGNTIVVDYDVPSEGYSGRWVSTRPEAGTAAPAGHGTPTPAAAAPAGRGPSTFTGAVPAAPAAGHAH
jgi:hypothetical protein